MAVVLRVLQPGGGGLVDDDGGVPVKLEHRGRAGRRQRALHHLRDGVGLARAGGQQQRVAGPQDRAQALGDGVGGDLIGGVEETGVVDDGLRVQGFHPGQGVQGARRLIEADVAVGAHAEQLDVDAAGVGDGLLVALRGLPRPGVHGVGAVDVAVGDVAGLVQDAIFSRPPGARTGVFIGGKDVTLALDMMKAARAAMVPSFEVSVFADPGGSFTTAAAMVACVERVLRQNYGRGLKGLRVTIFGAMGVVGFSSAVVAALEGAKVRIVAHDTLEPLEELARLAKEQFGAELEPVAGQTDTLKSTLLAVSDVVLTAGPAGVNILPRLLLSRAPGVLVAADVNAVSPFGIEGMDLFMNGVPLPGCSTLGVGALAIGDVKYKTQAGLFRRMIASKEPLDLDFRHAFELAREIVTAQAQNKRAPKATASKPRKAKTRRSRGAVEAAALTAA